jgi:hypothetical protein
MIQFRLDAMLQNKKPFKRIMLEGLHPVFLTLFYRLPHLRLPAEIQQIGKAGLLAPPPFQQPSHPDRSKQWHSQLKGFSFRPKQKEQGYSGGTAPGFNGIPY